MKQHVDLEAFFVSVAEGLLDQPLDPVVESLDRSVGQPMREEGEDVVQMAFAHPSAFISSPLILGELPFSKRPDATGSTSPTQPVSMFGTDPFSIGLG